jgi:hypothetical protein
MKDDCSCCHSLIEENNYFQQFEKNRRYEMAIHSLRVAAQHIRAKKNVCLKVIDHTSAGGLHMVRLCLNPIANTAFINLPEEPETVESNVIATNQGVKGGRNPTILHSIELLVAIYRFAEIEPLPSLHFGLPSEGCPDHSSVVHTCSDVVQSIPLMFDPPNTNAIIFHTQASKINPRLLSLIWYEIMKQDHTITVDPIRHTILVMPLSPSEQQENAFYVDDQPEHKRQLYVEVLPENVVKNKSRFRVLHLSKIRRWETQNLTDTVHLPQINKKGTKIVVNLG